MLISRCPAFDMMTETDVATLALAMVLTPDKLLTKHGEKLQKGDIVIASEAHVSCNTPLTDVNADKLPNDAIATTAFFATDTFTAGINWWQIVVAIIAACIILLCVLLVCIYFGCFKKRSKEEMEKEVDGNAAEMEQLNWQSGGGNQSSLQNESVDWGQGVDLSQVESANK